MSGARAVTTNQTDIYDKLEEVVRKYASTEYLRPVADHTRAAFTEAERFVEEFYKGEGCEVILDSGCGTGESTLNIALGHPEFPVIGIDKSVARLTKAGGNSAGTFPQNAFLVRAELLDFWRLALAKVKAGQWHIPYHALYYPNPWPKQSEATRRFHLHPIFPTLQQLGDTIELRTNWEIYAREFAAAAQIATPERTIVSEAFEPERPITAFERKYKEARQQLWRVVVSHD